MSTESFKNGAKNAYDATKKVVSKNYVQISKGISDLKEIQSEAKPGLKKTLCILEGAAAVGTGMLLVCGFKKLFGSKKNKK